MINIPAFYANPTVNCKVQTENLNRNGTHI